VSPRNRIFILLGIIFLISAGYYLLSTPRSQDLVMIGTVDANQVIVSPQVQGRLLKLLVDEGTAVKAGELVFVSGQVARGDDGKIIAGDIEAHTRQTLRNVERALALAGCSLRDVVKVTVWLQDATDFARFNVVYAEFFPGDKPARSTTQAKLVVDSKIEIEAIAVKR